MNKQHCKEIKSLIARFYMHNIQYRMGGVTLGQLHKRFLQLDSESNSVFWSSNSRRFYKNAKGSLIKDQRLINAIEKVVPGSKYVLNHPLWKVLEEPFADLDRVYELMQMLPAEFQSILFKKGENEGVYQRKPWKDKSPLQKIGLHNDLNALACSLLILREMELLEKWHRYVVVKWSVYELLSRLVYFEPIKSFGDELCHYINELFISPHNPISDDKIILEDSKSFYNSPRSIINAYFICDRLSGILWHAKQQKIIEEKQEDQIKFLFLAHEFGINSIERALKYSSVPEQSNLSLVGLIKTYNSKSIVRKLPKECFFD